MNCKNFEQVKQPIEQEKISDEELMQECKKYNITIDTLIGEYRDFVIRSFTDWRGYERSLDDLKKSDRYTYFLFLKRALTLKLLKESKENKNET